VSAYDYYRATVRTAADCVHEVQGGDIVRPWCGTPAPENCSDVDHLALWVALVRWWRQRRQRPGKHEPPDHHRPSRWRRRRDR